MVDAYSTDEDGNYPSDYAWKEYTQIPEEELWNNRSELADIFATETAEKNFMVQYVPTKYRNYNPWHQGFTMSNLIRKIQVSESELNTLYTALKKGKFRVLRKEEIK